MPPIPLAYIWTRVNPTAVKINPAAYRLHANYPANWKQNKPHTSLLNVHTLLKKITVQLSLLLTDNTNRHFF